ncbi:MAG: PEGA domain-containing protein [Phycisphaerae bacterium]
MSVRKLSAIALMAFFGLICLCSGCVERKLTITTEPSGALVSLNDEQIGTSPVTVGFEWYGDYSVSISKDGYQTLKTHRDLKRPLRDRFPFDLFDDIFSKRIDEYSWSFKLDASKPQDKDKLVDDAMKMQKQTAEELAKPVRTK